MLVRSALSASYLSVRIARTHSRAPEHAPSSARLPACPSVSSLMISLSLFYNGDGAAPGMQTPEPLGWDGSAYDLTLQLNLDTDLPETEEGCQELVDNLSTIKRHLFGAPLSLCFHAVETGAPCPERIQLSLRPNEYLFIIPDKQKVMVIFALGLHDPIDVQISRVFLMEFGEARKGSAAGAPTCVYDKPDSPPKPIQDVPMDVNVGFITFNLEARHFGGAKHDNAVNLISGFRSYLYYHIKCSKSDMHTRMRRRVESLLQVLNRAKPDHLLYGDKGQKRNKAAGKLR